MIKQIMYLNLNTAAVWFQALDYEGETQRELSINVENEVPYFTCKVKEKTPRSDLWEVDYSTKDDKSTHTSTKVIITVEDVNDPPAFIVTVKEAMLEENAPKGTFVEKVIAKDPDSSHQQDFVYVASLFGFIYF